MPSYVTVDKVVHKSWINSEKGVDKILQSLDESVKNNLYKKRDKTNDYGFLPLGPSDRINLTVNY